MKLLSCIAPVAAVLGLGVSASAATLDFTASPTPTSILGVSVSLSASGPITTTPYDGAAPAPGLASEIDGLGVGNDEITVGAEFITVSFDKPIRVTGFYFLDLFLATGGGSSEMAIAEIDGGPTLSFMGVDVFSPGGSGFRSVSLDGPITTTSIRLTAGAPNDAVGLADFALAGIEVVPIPIPASGVLLGVAALGVVVLSRRRAI